MITHGVSGILLRPITSIFRLQVTPNHQILNFAQSEINLYLMDIGRKNNSKAMVPINEIDMIDPTKYINDLKKSIGELVGF